MVAIALREHIMINSKMLQQSEVDNSELLDLISSKSIQLGL